MKKKIPLKTAPLVGFVSGEIELEITITTHFDGNGVITGEEMTSAQIVEGSVVVLDDPLLPEKKQENAK